MKNTVDTEIMCKLWEIFKIIIINKIQWYGKYINDKCKWFLIGNGKLVSYFLNT